MKVYVVFQTVCSDPISDEIVAIYNNEKSAKDITKRKNEVYPYSDDSFWYDEFEVLDN